MTQLEINILKVLKNNSVVGAAFLVSKGIAVTCAHVVKAAGITKGDSITLRLANGETKDAIVDPDLWSDVDAEDIAILRLEGSISGISLFMLGSSEGTKGHTFSTYGFPQTSQELSGRGEIIGYASLNGIKLIQLGSEQVTPGFSGAPVFDENAQRVIGIVVAITPPDEYKRQGTTAFAVPSESILEICPELQHSDICPYIGLETFTDETEQYFFGRDALTEKLLNVLREGFRLLAIFGSSGSGKSSVVRAGVLSELKKGRLPESQKWKQITMRPADDPFKQMQATGLDITSIDDYLKSHMDVESIVLFIDQFEELFTLCPDDLRINFVHRLETALDNSELFLILCMRDEFYSVFNAKASLLAKSDHLKIENVPGTLEENELMAMIKRPAEEVGLIFEEGLAERIIEDLTRYGEVPSSNLPLLEFALTQLWERRRNGALTHDAYQEIDGVTGSLTRWADKAFSKLTKEDQTLAEGLLTSLVHLGDEAQGLPDTRRRRSLTEFEEPTRRVVKYFADLRLLVTSSETVELIHDTLLREWGRLKKWLDENRNFLTWRQKLVERYREWKEERGELLRGRELAVAQDFWSKHRIDLDKPIESQKLEEYISSSEKQVKRTKWLIIASVVSAFLVLAAFGSIAWEQRNNALSSQLTSTAGLAAQIEAIANEKKALQTSQAESTKVANAQATAQANATLANLNAQQASEQETLKISEKLSNDSKSIIDTNYRLGLLLGVESVRLGNLSHNNPLPAMLNKMPSGLIRTMDLSSGRVQKIIYTPNGNLMVSMSDIITLWNTQDPLSPKSVKSWKASVTSKPNDVVFSPNSKTLIIGYQDGHIELWDVSTTNFVEIRTPDDFSSQSLDNIKVAVSPDSKFLAVAGSSTIKIWDISNLNSPQLKGRISRPHGDGVNINYLNFVPNSIFPLLVSGGQDNFLSIWDLKYSFNSIKRDGNPISFDTETPVVAISSEYLLIAEEESIRVFSYSGGERRFIDVVPYLGVQQSQIENMVVSPDNLRFIATTRDGRIMKWDLEHPDSVKVIKTFDGLTYQISSIAFHPSSKSNLLAVGGDDSTITIWDITQDYSSMMRNQILNDTEITDIAYGPKLNLLALGGDQGIDLWDISDPFLLDKIRSTILVRNPIRSLAFNPSETALLFLGDYTTDVYRPAVYRRDLMRLDYSENEYLFGTNTVAVFVVGNKYVLAGEIINGKTSIFQMDLSRINVARETVPLDLAANCPFKDTAFARNGDLAAVATCTVQLWDFSGGKVPTIIQELDSVDPRGVAFNPDGELLVSGNGNDTISIWKILPNFKTEIVATRIAHANGVTGIAISPDGKMMASGGGDQTAILWDITDPENPTQIANLGHHTSPVLNGGMFFLEDGKTMISASKDEVFFWDINLQSWIESACNIAGRNLTPSEWQQFVGPAIPYHPTCPEYPVPNN